METTELYSLQAGIDDKVDYIWEDAFELTAFAFKVELYELANTIEFFKFWKQNKGKPGQLEEYVDGLHFILSMGLRQNHTPKEVSPVILSSTKNTMAQFLQIEWALKHYQYHKRFEMYEQLFQLFLGLGELLGFTEPQIIAAYKKKNQINLDRQERGY